MDPLSIDTDGAGEAGPRVIQATCVSKGGRAVLILGPSGSGKSALALRLVALGAELVADDGTVLTQDADGSLMASAPDATRGLIEARGVGILRLPVADPAPVTLVVDLGRMETDRLPPHRTASVLGRDLPLVHKSESSHFPEAILLYLTYERSA